MGDEKRFLIYPVFIFLTAFILTVLSFVSFFSLPAFAAIGDCPSGYEFQRMSGVGCVQKNCASIPNAHYSYEGYCICGSAGSIDENPQDPNKRCTLPHENTSCPDCVYSCVHNNERCPNDKKSEVKPAVPTTIKSAPTKTTEEVAAAEAERISRILSQNLGNTGPRVVTAGLSWKSVKGVFQRGFSVSMQVLDWGLNKTLGWELNEDKDNETAGWAGVLISPSGDYVDVKVFDGSLKFDWEKKDFAAEFNLISIKGRPSSTSFVDGFSVGVGPGAVNKDEGNSEIPGTPISPNINFRNIKNYFSEKWDGTKEWWNENVPWPLGNNSRPAIGQ